MLLVEINLNPEKKQLRSFGAIALAAGVVLWAILFLYKRVTFPLSIIPLIAGAVIFFCSLVSHRLTRLIYVTMMLAALPIGLAVSFIVMTVFYLLIITPLALFFRIIGRDVLNRRFDSEAKSYWLSHKQCQNPERYFRQF
jgi:Na+/H+-translocating membrane pyrophosphatase